MLWHLRCQQNMDHGKFSSLHSPAVLIIWAIFVWPWNKNARTKQKQQTNGNRTIWLVYRTDTNARGFWLVKRTLGWKNFMPKNFLEISDTSLWRHTATRSANRTMPSHIRVFFDEKTESLRFDLFIHWLVKQITNTYRKSLYLCLLRGSKRSKWGSIPTKKSSRATLKLSFFDLLRTLSGFATGSPIIKTQKGTRPISNHLDRTSLAGKGFIKWAKKELYPAGPTRENISQPCLPRYWGIYWSNSERESYTWSDLTTPDI